MTDSYAKVLTKNDVGATGGHQAGIAVPKSDSKLLEFFPVLNLEEFNPCSWLRCIDSDGVEWKMRYIYYNGNTFTPPKSTRNEYRITHMTKYFTKCGAEEGDVVVFLKTNEQNTFGISIHKKGDTCDEFNQNKVNKIIVLRGWSRIY